MSGKSIGIIHPDLGIGGAEQLIVNIALALKNKGHDVTIYTPRHDPNRAFPETVNGTLRVEVRGSFFPRSIFGRFVALCTCIRMFLACMHVALFCGFHDVIVIDQISAVVPVLKLQRWKILFYCHFPDYLLCTERRSRVKRVYRYLLDSIEKLGLRFSSEIMVNSQFTQGVVKDALGVDKQKLHILNPCIEIPRNEPNSNFSVLDRRYIISLNRYERKKDVMFALKVYADIITKGAKDLRLIIAGGYDEALNENIEYLAELKEFCDNHKIKYAEISDWNNTYEDSSVLFAKNISSEQRNACLSRSLAVLYTPENGNFYLEHFGIVPLEAMVRSSPVLAHNSGGPLETVVEGKTGYLLPKTASLWSEKILLMMTDSDLRFRLGVQARNHIMRNFSLETMENKLGELL